MQKKSARGQERLTVKYKVTTKIKEMDSCVRIINNEGKALPLVRQKLQNYDN